MARRAGCERQKQLPLPSRDSVGECYINHTDIAATVGGRGMIDGAGCCRSHVSSCILRTSVSFLDDVGGMVSELICMMCGRRPRHLVGLPKT